MRLCRECEAVLWHRHESCPSCRAWAPHAAAGSTLSRPVRTQGLERLGVAVAVTAPVALAVVDRALHWVLTAL